MGRGAYIYLCSLLQPVGFCFSKILRLCHLSVTKSACPTATEKYLPAAICPHSRWRSQPLSRVSRKQRYNTLDFPTENRVPTGVLLAPIGNPEPKGLRPSGHLHIFFTNGTQTVKMQFSTTFQKIKNRCNFHPMQRLIIAAARYLCYFFNTELSIFLLHKFIGNSKNIGSDLLTLLLYCTVIQRIGKSCFYSRIKFVNMTVSCSGG